MGLFSSIAGLGLNLLGSKMSQRSQQRGVDAAMSAAQPFGVSGPFGTSTFSGGQLNIRPTGGLRTSMNQAITLGSRALTNLGGLDFEGREMAELERLRALRAPQIAQARGSLQSQLFNRGRLGAAVGGGLSGGMFNPETAAQEEAILRAQLGDIGAARQFSMGEQSFLTDQASRLFGIGGDLGNLALGQARMGLNPATANVAGIAAQPGFNQARTYEGFFSTLGQGLGGLSFGGTFGGGGGRPPLGFTHGQGL